MPAKMSLFPTLRSAVMTGFTRAPATGRSTPRTHAHAVPWIVAKVPLIISIAFKAGELPGAPISKTNGHLIVVRGFAKNGDVIVNDPAARDDASVQLTYPRAALEAAWAHSHRTAYLIYPSDWPQHPSPTGLRPQ